VDRAADRVCANCGGERRVVALRAVIPELARRYGVPVEVVAGEAARKLREAGGIAAWLR
jgi:peptide subunit release factor 1 (eRF1)